MSARLSENQVIEIIRIVNTLVNGRPNYAGMYGYIASQMRSGGIVGASVDQAYWFEQAAFINANLNSPSAVFIRSATVAGLISNAKPHDAGAVQAISDHIGEAVFRDVSRSKEIPDFSVQLNQDISAAISRGGMGIGGWGGAFYYWKYPYIDGKGNSTTVGGAILGDPKEYQIFINCTSKALVDTFARFGVGLLTDPAFKIAISKGMENYGGLAVLSVQNDLARRVTTLAALELGQASASALANFLRERELQLDKIRPYLPFTDASDVQDAQSLATAAVDGLMAPIPGGGESELPGDVIERVTALLAGRNLAGAVMDYVPGRDQGAMATEIVIRLASGETVWIDRNFRIASTVHTVDDDGNTLLTSTDYDGSDVRMLTLADGSREVWSTGPQGELIEHSRRFVLPDGTRVRQNLDAANRLIDTVTSTNAADGTSVALTTYPNGNSVAVTSNAFGETLQTVTRTRLPNGDEQVLVTDASGQQLSSTDIAYFHDETGTSRIETIQTAAGTVRNIYDNEGKLVRTDPVATPDLHPELPASTFSDISSLLAAVRAGQPIPILASGVRLLNDLAVGSGSNAFGTANSVAAGVLSFYNLYNAFKGHDTFNKVNATLSAVNYANLMLQETGSALYSQGLSSMLNGSATSVGALPAIGLVMAIKNEDPVGMAMSLGVLVNGTPFLASPIGIGLVAFSIAKMFTQKGPPDAWGVASVHFGPGITNLASEVATRGENFGPDRAGGQLRSVLAMFQQMLGQSNAAQPDSDAHIGLVPQRMPSITYRASEFADAGHQIVDIDPLTGAQRAPELRFDDDGQLFRVRPEQLSAETRAMLRLDGSPDTPPLVAYLINTALAREALAPLWQVQTARLQQEANDPDAGLSEQERAAKAGLGAALDTAYARSHARDPLAAERRQGHFMAVGVDLDGDGRIATRSIADNRAAGHAIARDWDGQGYLKDTGWIGVEDGFLVLDHNLNGSIDSSREMFSNPLLADRAKGLRSLAAYDANADGRIDAADPVFRHLKVWRDLDQDGDNTRFAGVLGQLLPLQDETGGQPELQGLQALGITAIDYANSRFERQAAPAGGSGYGALATVTLEAAEEGVRYTPVGSGIEIQASDGEPVIVVTQVASEAAVFRDRQIGAAGETLALYEDGRPSAYNPLAEGSGGPIPILIGSASLLANDTWGGAVGAASGLAITGVRAGAHCSAELLADGNVRLLLEANYAGPAELFYTVALPGAEALVPPAVTRVLLDITPVRDIPTVTAVADAPRQVYGWRPMAYDIHQPGTEASPDRHFVGLYGGEPVYEPHVEVVPALPIYSAPDSQKPVVEVVGQIPGKTIERYTPVAAESANTGRIVAEDLEGAGFAFEVLSQPLYGTATVDAEGRWSYLGRRTGFVPLGDIDGDSVADHAGLAGEGVSTSREFIPANVESNQHFEGETSFADLFTVRVYDKSDPSRKTFRDIELKATHFGAPPLPAIASSGGGKPIAIDLDGDGFHFVDVDDSRVFMDVNGDGWRRRIAWTSPGDGLLALDADGDGRVERFDEIGFIAHAPGQQTDLAALREAFDSNRNGRLDAGDARWEDFGVWQDANSNGITDAGEFQSLAARGITGLELRSDGRAEVIDGQTVFGRSSATLAGGGSLAVADVALRFSNEAQLLRPAADGSVSASTVLAPAFGQPQDFAGTAGKDLVFGTRASDHFAMGEGEDTVVDDGGDDVIEGGAGNDQLYAGAGNDFIHGDAGDDALYAGAGNDIAFGDEGDDLLMMDAGNDIAFGGAGQDFIAGGAGNDVLSGNEGDDRLIGEDGWDVLFGQAGRDELRGLEGNDQLYGGEGDDLLSGGLGDDRMEGGAGDDCYEVDSAADTVVEVADQGSDTVRSAIGYTLAAGLEHLELVGDQALNGSGNDAANQLTGNDAANALYGLAGDDRLDGGAGADRLEGGTGNDTYLVDHPGDTVHEEADGDRDLVISRVDFRLPDAVRDLSLVGTADIAGTGNALANRLRGNAGRNRLSGGDGHDELSGGQGDDELLGGRGEDVYRWQPGDGLDTIRDGSGRTLVVLGEGVRPEQVNIHYSRVDGGLVLKLRIRDEQGRELDGQGLDIYLGARGAADLRKLEAAGLALSFGDQPAVDWKQFLVADENLSPFQLSWLQQTGSTSPPLLFPLAGKPNLGILGSSLSLNLRGGSRRDLQQATAAEFGVAAGGLAEYGHQSWQAQQTFGGGDWSALLSGAGQAAGAASAQRLF